MRAYQISITSIVPPSLSIVVRRVLFCSTRVKSQIINTDCVASGIDNITHRPLRMKSTVKPKRCRRWCVATNRSGHLQLSLWFVSIMTSPSYLFVCTDIVLRVQRRDKMKWRTLDGWRNNVTIKMMFSYLQFIRWLMFGISWSGRHSTKMWKLNAMSKLLPDQSITGSRISKMVSQTFTFC